MAAPSEPTDLQRALSSCRSSFLMVGLFSMFINFLMLVPPLYMLQVYDRVISARSIDMLVSARLYGAMFRKSPLMPGAQTAQPLSDLTSLCQFLTGNGLFASFDILLSPPSKLQ